MKTREIASRFNIDKKGFEEFLLSNSLKVKGGTLFGYSVDDCCVQEYVDLYNSYLRRLEAQRKAEAKEKEELEKKRRAEEEVRRKAELAAAEEKRRAEAAAAEERRRAEAAAAEERRRAEAAAAEERRRAEAAAAEERRRAEEEKERIRTTYAAERIKRIAAVENELREKEASEETEKDIICEDEEGGNVMANYVKLYKEKLKGRWIMSGASYADHDLFGIWLNSLIYTGEDGKPIKAVQRLGKEFEYKAYLTSDESGRCKLLVNGNPNGFCSTLGEITFTDDNDVFVIQGTNSSFVFTRDKDYIPQ